MLKSSSFHPTSTLYRVLFNSGVDSHVGYLFAPHRDAARHIALGVIPLVFGGADLSIVRVESYGELIERGVSAELDLRVFEFAHRHHEVVQWIENPLFLTPEPTLLARWQELHEGIGRARTRDLLRRY